MSNPYESPNFDAGQNYGEFQTPQGVTPSSLVQQVRVVAILNAVQGGLEVIMGLIWIAYGVLMPTVMMNDPNFREQMNRQPDGPPVEFMNWMFVGFGVLGAILLGVGITRIVAGVRNWGFRGRMLGIVSLILGMISALGCYCAPTAIAVLVYGLIVYLNPSVTQAFEMGAQGAPGDRILYEFSPYRQQDKT